MDSQRLQPHWAHFFKCITIFVLLHLTLVSSFDLYSKSIYLVEGTNTYDLDTLYPFSPGDSGGEIGSRSGSGAWMDLSGTAWVFGGLSTDGVNYLNDMWKFKEGTWYWMTGSWGVNDVGSYNITGYDSLPANRIFPATWVDQAGDLWMFGGNFFDSTTNITSPLSDLWKFNIATSTWTWVNGGRINESAINRTDGPNSRSQAASWVQDNKLYLFGGLLFDLNATNDLWVFDVDAQNWTQLAIDQGADYSSPVGYPPSRVGAAVASDATRAWLFGGATATGDVMSDLWQYTTASNTWAWVGGKVAANDAGSYPTTLPGPGYPAARVGACSWFDLEGFFWIYGGTRDDVSGTIYYGDFWKVDITRNNTFYWVGTSDTVEFPSINATGGPGPRSDAVSWMDAGGDMFFFGGMTSLGSRSDVWVLDMNSCAVNNSGCFTNCTNVLMGPSLCSACPAGTTGDGRSPCQDIDECAVNNGGCDSHTNCTNNYAAPPNCSACPRGFNGTGYTSCTNYNPCEINHGGCALLASCTPAADLTGPPICGPCPVGYNGTGYTNCTDFNECLVNNGGCDKLTNCTNNLGGIAPTCSNCPMYYSGNGATGCKDIDECAVNKGGCDPLTTCTNNIGGPPTCGSCPQYYVGTGATGCVDFDECAYNNGGCTADAVCTNNVGAPPTCGPCIKGFIGNNFCSSSGKSATNAGLIAGVTIGGFVVLLAVIWLIFHFTNDKVKSSPSTTRLQPPETRKFELQALSQA